MNEVAISEETLSIFGMQSSRASWRLDVIAERYAEVVKDADHVFSLFTQEELAYMFRHVEEFEILTFGPVSFKDQTVFSLEQDQKACEEGSFVSVPSTVGNMIEKLNKLTVAEEIALVDGLEKDMGRSG